MRRRRHRATTTLRATERGASYVEYLFLVSLIAIVYLVSIRFFGTGVSQSFSSNASQVQSVD